MSPLFHIENLAGHEDENIALEIRHVTLKKVCFKKEKNSAKMSLPYLTILTIYVTNFTI